ncbi:MAG: helix-turn-helix domain-containing protein [Hyphomonadaceae bacterium]|nr:helix-turn-helix domain-containing protein [Hyphomonadaceae bacterium]
MSNRGIESLEYAQHDLSAAEFIEGTRDAWNAAPFAGDEGASRFAGQFWSAANCVFLECELGPFMFEGTKEHVQNGGPMVGFERFISGNEYGLRGDEDHCDGPGAIRVVDQRLVFHSIATHSVRQDIMIPRAALGLAEGERAHHQMFRPHGTMGQLLFKEWDELYAGFKRGDRVVATDDIFRLISLLKIAMGASPQREDVRRHAREAMRRQICRFIEANLRNRELDVSTLLRHFGVSRASLYRMFEDVGGVRAHIRDRRVFRALVDIANAEQVRGAILAASERWGFSSMLSFNGVVKRQFGHAPSTLLAPAFEARKDQGNARIAPFLKKYSDERWAPPPLQAVA